ncbi:MAG: fumarate reductase/succinate dehydrogenase flavoprotein subunit [Desulfocapsa sp.]|uniref:Fumarate reductase/succinate dehydrogenase flavoprotein subunit n=1 Tax=Desulfotalea psychrophila TaxID=84980 RepID=A0ABS3ATJ1_9BACT|nr:fumarate reductase/succinate dehydrogenase flavoprotein subunit [Desulfocapsa sp.]MBN4052917.1 fumarate reductase/succinate dehydrogenase flavoprotein subunit [bacterium AH-315-K15]MBN4063912.1 fumarate reductase/succinate dehydrogenase flavoprotein subunit [bacterium AH-315-I07]MBN4068088.1 fumarate reductase/succinate dehydrogenase flavoprotein subunit [Desulfotalea psychrophila]
MELKSNVPEGPLSEKWDNHRFSSKLVNPANRRKYSIIVVGTGLAGASASATLAEQGYEVETFCIQDSPRRAHSIAAQGGINAAKNYQNDGDSILRLFYDTIKGGDFRSREANVYRLAQVSNSIIDQCVAQGVPFAREYGGTLANRSFGGAQVSRTFYARGQTGQQLLLGAYSALARQIKTGKVTMHTRKEMMELVLVDGKARGIVTRDTITGKLETYSADAVILATGGYGNAYFLSTNAMASNVTAAWRAHKKGAGFANPCFIQIHPTCIPVHGSFQSKLTLMSESLRNDGRVWVPKKSGDTRRPGSIPENERDYYLESKYPSFGNLVPRDVASRNAKEQCDDGKGVGTTNLAVYLDFAEAISRDGEATILKKYGNLFQMYEKITDSNPLHEPMMIYPAVHYTMGGLWVDYNLMTTIPGLFAIGECNFSDHGANRLGASALMQGLADGYFIIGTTIAGYLGSTEQDTVDNGHEQFLAAKKSVQDRIAKLLRSSDGGPAGKFTVDEIHKELGLLLWDHCGMARNKEGLEKALTELPEIQKKFWNNVYIPGTGKELNQSLERAGRLADFLEFAEIMILDALDRAESCGCHLREESQTEENEAKRDDARYSHVAVWEYQGEGGVPKLHKEPLIFENVTPSQRSYK